MHVDRELEDPRIGAHPGHVRHRQADQPVAIERLQHRPPALDSADDEVAIDDPQEGRNLIDELLKIVGMRSELELAALRGGDVGDDGEQTVG